MAETKLWTFGLSYAQLNNSDFPAIRRLLVHVFLPTFHMSLSEESYECLQLHCHISEPLETYRVEIP